MAHLADTPTLQTERLTLRAPGPQDWEAWAAFVGTDRAEFIGGKRNRADAWRGFGHFIGHWVLRGWGSFVVCDKGADRAIASVGPWYPEGWPEREIGWTVWDPAREGTGVAREAANAALRHAFDDLGWTTAVSYIDPANARSIALAERLGAGRDEKAPRPGPDDLVYRHPRPGADA